jgi:hypothetical protein
MPNSSSLLSSHFYSRIIKLVLWTRLIMPEYELVCKIYKLISHQALYILYICDVLISSDCRIEYHSVMQLMSFIICFISCAKCLACLVTLRRAGLRSQGPYSLNGMEMNIFIVYIY